MHQLESAKLSGIVVSTQYTINDFIGNTNISKFFRNFILLYTNCLEEQSSYNNEPNNYIQQSSINNKFNFQFPQQTKAWISFEYTIIYVYVSYMHNTMKS